MIDFDFQSLDIQFEVVCFQFGDIFFDFLLFDVVGDLYSLGQYDGKYVVLYVYFKDDIFGCIREVCDFCDYQFLWQYGVVILGVSCDDVVSYQQFVDKYSLFFLLLSDLDVEFLWVIGSYGFKMMYGKISEGVKWQMFLIGFDGKFVKLWLVVQVDGYVDVVVVVIDKDL